MDRLTSVEWLRMKADGFYNVFEQERFLEAADEIERLREALEARPSNEELKLAEKHCDWNAFKHAFGAVMKHRRSALQQKDSE